MKEENTKEWQYPPLDLLDEPVVKELEAQDTERISKIIIDTLKSHKVSVVIDPDEINVGPTFTQYPLVLKSPTYVSKIKSLEKELALAVASPNGSVRIEPPVPGKSRVEIEVPNTKRKILYFKTAAEVLREESNNSNLLFPLGIDVESKTHIQDVKKLPNLTIIGSTGTGKSILLHNIIISILLNKTPDKVKLLLIDPKMGVEFQVYSDIPHLINPVITNFWEGETMLSWATEEMERRQSILAKASVKTTKDYNDKIGSIELPDIVIIADEIGYLLVQKPGLEGKSIVGLAQTAKNVGVHLIISTSRPSVHSITGLIRANITCRVAFRVQSQIESRLIIGEAGAEKLLGKGDMLFLPLDSVKPIRLQVPGVSVGEIERVAEFVKKQDN